MAADSLILAERAAWIEAALYGRSDGATQRRSDEGEDGPVSAASLAVHLKGHENWGHETRRRRVREAVEYGREHLGMRICANGAGYWMARDHDEWAQFQESQKRGAVFKFVRIAKSHQAATERISRQQMIGDWGRRGLETRN